jgi:hypothetical protein
VVECGGEILGHILRKRWDGVKIAPQTGIESAEDRAYVRELN